MTEHEPKRSDDDTKAEDVRRRLVETVLRQLEGIDQLKGAESPEQHEHD